MIFRIYHLTFSHVTTDLCLTFENESAMKKEATKWQKGRDIWWQVLILCALFSTPVPFHFQYDIKLLALSNLQDVVPKYPTTCDVEWVDAEDPLFLLYTSGSTGKPKVIESHKIYKSFFIRIFILWLTNYDGAFHRVFCILQEDT